MKKVAIMQPYLFPYIGYFQLVHSADEFIIYDNIEYTKKGWINRNRILFNGSPQIFTIPLKKDSDFLKVDQRKISDSWDKERSKILNSIRTSYKKSPYFESIFPLVEECLNFREDNLFKFILNSVEKICNFLDIKTPIVNSSSLDIDHSLKSQDKVLSICINRGSTMYINAIGGMNLYSKKSFKDNGIDLKFIKSSPIQYDQFKNEFVPWLSIIDVMMFNSKEKIKEYLNLYELI